MVHNSRSQLKAPRVSYDAHRQSPKNLVTGDLVGVGAIFRNEDSKMSYYHGQHDGQEGSKLSQFLRSVHINLQKRAVSFWSSHRETSNKDEAESVSELSVLGFAHTAEAPKRTITHGSPSSLPFRRPTTKAQDFCMHSESLVVSANMGSSALEAPPPSSIDVLSFDPYQSSCAEESDTKLDADELRASLIFAFLAFRIVYHGACRHKAVFTRTTQSSDHSKDTDCFSKDQGNETRENTVLATLDGKKVKDMARKRKEDEREDGSSDRRAAKAARLDTDKLLFACPYYKADPDKYQGCHKYVLRNPSVIRLHFRRFHRKPVYYCATCFEIFDTSAQRDFHSDLRLCVKRENPFVDLIDDEMYRLMGKGRHESDREWWYKVFTVLFPGCEPPTSPYADANPDAHALYVLSLNLFSRIGPFAQEIYEILQTSNIQPMLPGLRQSIINQAWDHFQEGINRQAQRSRTGTFNLNTWNLSFDMQNQLGFVNTTTTTIRANANPLTLPTMPPDDIDVHAAAGDDTEHLDFDWQLMNRVIVENLPDANLGDMELPADLFSDGSI